ncbi:MAG: hypothetical protein LBK72_01365, partial [Bifidobacteriaceae bacterium]|nr:hypothetical protein [Bifidobacteriaceae bacterium]
MTPIKSTITTALTIALVGAGALTGPFVAHSEPLFGPDTPSARIEARLGVGLGSTLIAMPDGSICGWGIGAGVSGIHLTEDPDYDGLEPICITLPGGAAATAVKSFMQTVALTDQGDVWSWGVNEYGQLGQGGVGTYTTTPGLVDFSEHEEISAIDVGIYHTLALSEDGDIYGWGANRWGQLGNDNIGAATDRPSRITTDVAFKAMAAGWFHTLTISQEGDVYAWGSDESGQLGPNRVFDPTAGPKNDKDGDRDEWLSGEVGKVAGLPGHIAQVAAGHYHSVALSESGEVYTWGSAAKGQLGNGTTSGYFPTPVKVDLPPIAGICAGGEYTLAWTASGDLYAWGANRDGNLGFGTNADESIPRQVPGISVAAAAAGSMNSHTVAVGTDGRIYTWGANIGNQLGTISEALFAAEPQRIEGLPPIVSISAGGYTSMAITSEGDLYAWGGNDRYQLGTDAASQRNVPMVVEGLPKVDRVDVGLYHVAALTTDGEVWTWGSNEDGELGTPVEANQKYSPQPKKVELGENIEAVDSVAVGRGFTMLLDGEGVLWEWGAGRPDGPGGTPEPGSIQDIVSTGGPDLQQASAFAIGDRTVIALAENRIWGFGAGGWNLGDRTRFKRMGEAEMIKGLEDTTIVSADVAESFTMALDSDGAVWTLGDNQYFQLGRPKMNDNLHDLVPARVEGLPEISAVCAENYTAAALSRGGEVFTWGWMRSLDPSNATWEESRPARVRGFADKVVQVAVGTDHVLALTERGEVWGWGSNADGQLSFAPPAATPEVRVSEVRLWEPGSQSTDTPSTEPAGTDSSEPDDTASPTPSDAASPAPSDTASPGPGDGASPTPSNSASPTPSDPSTEDTTSTDDADGTGRGAPDPGGPSDTGRSTQGTASAASVDQSGATGLDAGIGT